ncbi:hypothetical protein [Aurantimonas sp. A3-2-R12]|uniref:hypothetical protein n=1 Tax=Aurantimonas sp. A3-2-R12 TaxID=3114362 RepID=UPI002E183A7D|nr:hypothetical protein [Aurantimonas sp. A3-2-R12]
MSIMPLKELGRLTGNHAVPSAEGRTGSMRPGDFASRKTIYFSGLHQKVAATRLAADSDHEPVMTVHDQSAVRVTVRRQRLWPRIEVVI